MDISTIHANTKQMLTDYPETRLLKNRKIAHIKYWQLFEGVGNFGISIKKYPFLTSPETISRAIRKIQELNPELTSDENEADKSQIETNFIGEIYKKPEEMKDEYKNGNYK